MTVFIIWAHELDFIFERGFLHSGRRVSHSSPPNRLSFEILVKPFPSFTSQVRVASPYQVTSFADRTENKTWVVPYLHFVNTCDNQLYIYYGITVQ